MEPELILIVEDNPDDEALTLRALARSRIPSRVRVARDGVDALVYLHGGAGIPAGALPKMILLDLKLPRLDGLEVLRRLRAHPRTGLLPVVMLTSSIEEGDVSTCYRHGANSYVRKPSDFAAFAAVVDQVSAYWLALNHAPPPGQETP